MSATTWSGGGRRVFINEVGMRDGLQMEQIFVPTAQKVELVNALSRSGVAKIEVTALVSPKAIPAMRDAEIVLRTIDRVPGVTYSALVPNVRGAERAIDSMTDEFNLVMSVSETHNLSNLRMTREQSFNALAEVIALARQTGTSINTSLSCSFGCPMEGDIAEEEVLRWCARFVDDMGVQGVTLCDTTGMAYPTQVAHLTTEFLRRWPGTDLTLHFHNTRGMGLANVLASIDAGAMHFDASIGGLGGCPYAPGATGNVCSEEVVHALQLMGFDTGVDLPQLLAVSSRLPALLGHETPSQITKAGCRLELHPPPEEFVAIRERAWSRNS